MAKIGIEQIASTPGRAKSTRRNLIIGVANIAVAGLFLDKVEAHASHYHRHSHSKGRYFTSHSLLSTAMQNFNMAVQVFNTQYLFYNSFHDAIAPLLDQNVKLYDIGHDAQRAQGIDGSTGVVYFLWALQSAKFNPTWDGANPPPPSSYPRPPPQPPYAPVWGTDGRGLYVKGFAFWVDVAYQGTPDDRIPYKFRFNNAGQLSVLRSKNV